MKNTPPQLSIEGANLGWARFSFLLPPLGSMGVLRPLSVWILWVIESPRVERDVYPGPSSKS